MFFERYEIHIQAFGNVFDHFPILIFTFYDKNEVLQFYEQTNEKHGTYIFTKNGNFWFRYSQNNISLRMFPYFLDFLKQFCIIWVNTGFQGFEIPEIMKMLSFDV